MSLPECLAGRLARVAAAVMLAALVGGCFTPMYGERVGGESVVADLRGIYIPTAGNRLEQKLRNELIFAFSGNGQQQGAAYKLDMKVATVVRSVIVQPNRDADRRSLQMSVRFSLSDSTTGETLFSGSSVARASFEYDIQLFANERALIDAEDRASNTVAENIKTRLAAYFATRS